jgi:hypothetical protein
MAKAPELPTTRYRVVLQENGTYGVEVTLPGELPAVVRSFSTEAEAEAWITAEMMSGAENGI